jgi:ABC-type branched-subunit amino acid transport system ATPase component
VSAALEIRGLGKAFGGLPAIDGVSLSVEQGERRLIIGPNGAGKTTFFNLLTGSLAPSSGKILFDGRDITGTPAHRIPHLGLARSFQRTNVFPAFSLFDNVWVAAFARARAGRRCARCRATVTCMSARAKWARVDLAHLADRGLVGLLRGQAARRDRWRWRRIRACSCSMNRSRPVARGAPDRPGTACLDSTRHHRGHDRT